MKHLLASLLLCTAALHAQSTSSKMSKDLDNIPALQMVEVVIQFDNNLFKDFDKALKGAGVNLKTKFKHIDAITINVPKSMISFISKMPGVKYVTPNRSLRGSLEYAQPGVYANIAYQYNWTGAGIGVAIIDSGVNTQHGDLSTRVVYSQSFVPNDPSTADAYGHGTHVAGIVAGNAAGSTVAGSSRVFRGIAPSANIINLRVLDATGSGNDIAVISAIDRAVELKGTYNIRVINLSLGRSADVGRFRHGQSWRAG